MIELVNLSKRYRTSHGRHLVLDQVNLKIAKGEKIGILGRNGAGKSTLIRILGGAELPTSGEILRSMSVSWPLAFASAVQGSLTGIDNTRFICRIYNADPNKVIPFVEEFSELGKFLREPVKTYSAGMAARLAFAVSMAVEFDCYLIDEVIAVGDSRFHAKCQEELFHKRKDRALVLVSHLAKNIIEHCDRACVLHDGKLLNFSSVDEAYSFYDTHA